MRIDEVTYGKLKTPLKVNGLRESRTYRFVPRETSIKRLGVGGRFLVVTFLSGKTSEKLAV